MSLNLINPFTKFGGGGGGGVPYFELLSRASGALPVVSFTAMPYLQVLTDMVPTSRANYSLLANSSTVNDYAGTVSDDGAVDWQFSSSALGFPQADSGQTPMFAVGNYSNYDTQDKLNYNFGMCQAPDMATTGIPERRVAASKWASSPQISSFLVQENGGGAFTSGSEIVVLGYDPAVTSGTSTWESLAEIDYTGGSTSVIDSSTITSKKYMYLEFLGVSAGTGNIDTSLTINGLTTSTYCYRIAENSGAERTGNNTTQAICQYSGNDSETFLSAFILNKSGSEKLFITHQQNRQTAGAGTTPYWNEGVSKSTTTAAITSIQVQNNGGGAYTSGCKLRIWGFD